MFIGKEYKRNEYNCAHYVADWYRVRKRIEIPVISVFDRSFIVWLRKHFHPVVKPGNDDLVLMVNNDGSYHIGVYFDHGVFHNFEPEYGSGSVCKWTMSSVKKYYKEVRFYKWSE